jgi:hypothetical protein
MIEINEHTTNNIVPIPLSLSLSLSVLKDCGVKKKG